MVRSKRPVYNSGSKCIRGEGNLKHLYYFYTLLTADSETGRKPARIKAATVTKHILRLDIFFKMTTIATE